MAGNLEPMPRLAGDRDVPVGRDSGIDARPPPRGPVASARGRSKRSGRRLVTLSKDILERDGSPP